MRGDSGIMVGQMEAALLPLSKPGLVLALPSLSDPHDQFQQQLPSD